VPAPAAAGEAADAEPAALAAPAVDAAAVAVAARCRYDAAAAKYYALAAEYEANVDEKREINLKNSKTKHTRTCRARTSISR
jgi:hypothetical protein